VTAENTDVLIMVRTTLCGKESFSRLTILDSEEERYITNNSHTSSRIVEIHGYNDARDSARGSFDESGVSIATFRDYRSPSPEWYHPWSEIYRPSFGGGGGGRSYSQIDKPVSETRSPPE
jgi:hypothetical protein